MTDTIALALEVTRQKEVIADYRMIHSATILARSEARKPDVIEKRTRQAAIIRDHVSRLAGDVRRARLEILCASGLLPERSH